MRIFKPRVSFIAPKLYAWNFRSNIEECKKFPKEVTVDPFEIAPLDKESELFKAYKSFLEELKDKKTYPFFVKIFDLISDPEKFLAYLKPLENKLGEKMREEHLQIGDDIIPHEVLMNLELNIFFPPIPQELNLNCKKNRILSRVIADSKLQRGQNAQDITFLDLVEVERASKFVGDGYLFSDKTTISAEKNIPLFCITNILINFSLKF